MEYKQMFSWLFVLSVILCCHTADSHPLSKLIERQKRMSDQRLAELETLIALSKMKQKLVTVPVGYGHVDPAKLGRRRRSIQKLLRTLARDSSSASEEFDVRERDSEENRLEEDENLLLNLLYNKDLRHRFNNFPLRLND